jgi:hypothetical protein
MMDYREILSESYHQRRRQNPRYSLRAFARDISLSPSRLSEIIGGKGELSREKGTLIAKRLQLSPIRINDFIDMIEAVSAPRAADRESEKGRISIPLTNRS